MKKIAGPISKCPRSDAGRNEWWATVTFHDDPNVTPVANPLWVKKTAMTPMVRSPSSPENRVVAVAVGEVVVSVAVVVTVVPAEAT